MNKLKAFFLSSGLGDKGLLKSLTVIGGALYLTAAPLLQNLFDTGVIDYDTLSIWTQRLEWLGGIVAIIGGRKVAGKMVAPQRSEMVQE